MDVYFRLGEDFTQSFTWTQEKESSQDFETEVKQLLASQANALPTNKRKAFNQHIALIAAGIFFQIKEMKRQGVSAEQIAHAQKSALQQLRHSADEFQRNKERYIEKNNEVQKKLGDVQACIESSNLEFEELHPPQNDLWTRFRRQRIEEHMAIARVSAQSIEMINWTIEKTFVLAGTGLSITAEHYCRLSPMHQLACESISDAAKTGCHLSLVLFKKTGLARVTQSVLKFLRQEPTALVEELQKVGIPKEQALQYHYDSLETSLFFLPLGTIGKGLKLPFKSIGRATKLLEDSATLAKTAPKVTSLPSLQKSLDEIYALLEGKGHVSVHQAVRESVYLLESVIPDFSKVGLKEEKLWTAVVKQMYPQFAENPHVKFYKNNSGTTVSRLSDTNFSFVIKEKTEVCTSFHELLGIDFQASLNLRLQIPTPLAFGKYRVADETRYFVVKSFVPGETFWNTMQKIGKGSSGSLERHSLVADFKLACREAGMCLGDLHCKGLVETLTHEAELKQFKVKLEYLADHLDDLGITMPNLYRTPKMKQIVENLPDSPRYVSFALHDIHPDQFTWWKNPEIRVGHIDAETLPKSFNIERNALTPTQHDFMTFVEDFDRVGKQLGLNSEEASVLKEAFREGYKAEFKGKMSEEAEVFYKIQTRVNHMHSVARKIPKNEEARSELTRLIEELILFLEEP